MRIAKVLIACCICSLMSGAVSAAVSADVTAADTVRSKFDAFNRHDVESIEKIYASSARLRSPDYPNLVGNELIADTYRRIFDAVPDAKDELELLESAGNHIYVQFVLTGHLKGAQDSPIVVRIISVYAVKDGRIVDDTTYYDRKPPAN